MSSMLHDIGKVGIPDRILLKPGKLDPDEWEMMKKHTMFGWEVLHKADRELGEQSFLTLAATIALSHHETLRRQRLSHGQRGGADPALGAHLGRRRRVRRPDLRPSLQGGVEPRARGAGDPPAGRRRISIRYWWRSSATSTASSSRSAVSSPVDAVKSAVIAVVGRPSSGKSTLVNALCGGKVSIVSPVPQTTRNRVRGILTDAAGADRVHRHSRGSSLRQEDQSLHDAARLLHAFGGGRRAVRGGWNAGGGRRRARDPGGAADRCTAPGGVHEQARLPAAPSGPTCARMLGAVFPAGARCARSPRCSGEGLDVLKEALFAAAPEGDQLYPKDYYTDQTPDFRISEIVREKAMLQTREEVPHSLYVRIEDLEMRDDGATLWARGFICVERESQKGIVVGREGERIKSIVRDAERELSEIFPRP